LLHVGICCESLASNVFLKRSKEKKITGHETDSAECGCSKSQADLWPVAVAQNDPDVCDKRPAATSVCRNNATRKKQTTVAMAVLIDSLLCNYLLRKMMTVWTLKMLFFLFRVSRGETM
jgi:hypothetical protein